MTELDIVPCSNCEKVYTRTILGSRCPSCQVMNWKYQRYVILPAIMVGAIIAVSAVLSVFNKF